jgi:hypothetical protein
MRSSKSRSRSKSNRNRPSGNIVNRVFDSSGPEGKVRGTPQQIIDKYNQLARDAQLSNDRVAFENFQQHAEHYTRMLGEALREQEAFRVQNQDRGGDRQQHQGNQRRDETDQDDQYDDSVGGDVTSGPDRMAEAPRGDTRHGSAGPADSGGPGLGDSGLVDSGLADSGDGDTGLVETPENAEPARPRRPRRPRGRAGDAGEGSGAPVTPESKEAAE